MAFPNARTTIWLYRIPSLIGAVGAVLATYWCALAFVSRRGALLAALMMAASTLLGGEARLAKTDAVLLFTVVAAMGVLARVYLAPAAGGVAPPGLAQLRDILDGARGRHPRQGTAHSDGGRARRGDAVDS